MLKLLAPLLTLSCLPLACDRDQNGVADHTEPNRGCVVTFEGYNSDPIDVEPPCRLDWLLEQPPSTDPMYLDVNEAEFSQECADMGGTVTDTVGDMWRCEGVDY